MIRSTKIDLDDDDMGYVVIAAIFAVFSWGGVNRPLTMDDLVDIVMHELLVPEATQIEA